MRTRRVTELAGVLVVLALLGAARICAAGEDAMTSATWTAKKAQRWYEGQPWMVGCNFIPSTAINQLEMWQAETFDPATLDRELGWAKELGFTSVRVFLHDLLWKQDREGFLRRMDQFLGIADRHGIGVMFVLFDSVWNPYPKLGRQPEPRPRVMGSAWVQSPGAEILRDPALHEELKEYVTGVVGRFRGDRRVQIWDIWNEPDNSPPQYRDVEIPNKAEPVLALIPKAFAWAREARPSQPLTSGVWIGQWSDPEKLSAMERFQLENSDVITFHSYDPLPQVKECVRNLRRYGRPILCTEYVARPRGSMFDPLLGFFRDEKVGAYNWGLVLGKTQTNYPWDSWDRAYESEPEVWFHDILKPDGTPHNRAEVEYIRKMTGR